MEEFAKKLKSIRQKKKISIDEVSKATMIRPHIIEAMEEGNLDIDSSVYVKAHLKSYARFLKVPFETELTAQDKKISAESESGLKPSEISDNNKKYAENNKKPQITDIDNSGKVDFDDDRLFEKEKSDYAELFKKQNTKKNKNNQQVVNYLIYASLLIIAGGIIYFTFFAGGSQTNIPQGYDPDAKADTALIEEKTESNNLLSYFEESDSLKLTANASDSAWLRIEIDGKTREEILLLPGMQKSWSASEFFVLNQGNVGAVEWSRNGEKLEPFGDPGSVVKNIKITEDQIINSAPWNNDSIKRIRRTRPGSEAEDNRPRVIEPSRINSSIPLIRRDTNRTD
ncbi:MAG: helix-turn-helix domain-containing protein [Candidatus Kapaibacterium sp.]